MTDAAKLCDLADLPVVECEDDDAFEWPEDAQTLPEKLEHVAVWIEAQSDAAPDEAQAFAAVLREAAELVERVRGAL